jgi:hypothetical protein
MKETIISILSATGMFCAKSKGNYPRQRKLEVLFHQGDTKYTNL